MKLYEVLITVRSVVIAESETDAERTAMKNLDGIMQNDQPDISVLRPIESRSGLPDGWDHTCLPWGSDDDKMIGQILRVSGHRSEPGGEE